MTAPSEVYIRATDTDPLVRTRTELADLHQRLLAGLAALIDARHSAEAPPNWRRTVVEFCDRELRRHLAATDAVFYVPASGAAETRELIRALRTTVVRLDERVTSLSTAIDRDTMIGALRDITAVLTVHLAVERGVLLPALAALPGLDLKAQLAELRVLLAGGEVELPAVIDVREVPHGQRHPRVFARYAHLAPGESFVLVNGHDPKPLRREFEAAHPGGFGWDYEERGPELWRVRISRVVTDA